LGKALRLTVELENLPVLYHCVSGKDRTGVLIALLLLILGVPEELVISDYTLSNLYSWHHMRGAKKRVQKVEWMSKLLGVRVEQFYPLIASPPSLLQDTLTYLQNAYHSVPEYLMEKAGLDCPMLNEIKAILLT